MADNRTTAKTNITTINVPSVSNAEMNTMLKDELADNIVFLADVAVVQTSSTTNITVNFTDKDRIDLTRTGGALNITVSGLDDGTLKYLKITKTAGEAITWVGVTDITPVKENITSQTLVLYEIIRKGSDYFARAWVETVIQATDTVKGVLRIATQIEHENLTDNDIACVPGRLPISNTVKQGLIQIADSTEHNDLSSVSLACVPGRLPAASTSQRGLIEHADTAQFEAGTDIEGLDPLCARPSDIINKFNNQQAWITATLKAGWSGTLKYFKDAFGFVHVWTANLQRSTDVTGTSSVEFWETPSDHRPDVGSFNLVVRSLAGGGTAKLHIAFQSAVDGFFLQPEPDNYTSPDLIAFYAIWRS